MSALESLKESLLAEEQAEKSAKPSKSNQTDPKAVVKKKRTKKRKSAQTVDTDKKINTAEEKEPNTEKKEPNAGKKEPNTEKKEPNTEEKELKTEEKESKATKKRAKKPKTSKTSKPLAPAADANKDTSKESEASFKITRHLSKKRKGEQQVGVILNTRPNPREVARSKAARAHLVKIIEDVNLSPSERVKAVRKLRSSLVTKPPGIDSPPPIRKVMSIKEVMQKNFSPSRDFKKIRAPRPVVWQGLATPKPVRTGPMKIKPGFDIKSVDAGELHLVPLDTPQPPVPKLSYGLERVLFNPGVYHLQDPRSRVFNFDPYLAKIMPVSDFDFNALKQYITSSRDKTLLGTAKAEGKKYTGSTSSMTAALAHFHFLLSQWRPINTGALSQNFPVPYSSFTSLQRGPSAVFLRWKDGVYAIDADKQYDTANILSMLGKSMEKLLTLPTEDFEKYRKENSDQITEEERNEAEAFNYSTIGDFLLRSQLDAYDPRLPGTGMFDLKTRAVISIRMDSAEYEQGMGYEIKGRHGEYESFEREYYDMIRAAFLKYSLQVRMGRMDGIFVAFHNTERIFGFQYISLSEMDYALHGTDNTVLGDSEFKLSLDLLNRVLDKATAKYPEKSLRLHFETRSSETPFMYIFAEPMEEEDIQAVQESNQAAVLEFEQNILGLGSAKTEEELLEERKNAEWQSLRAKVEDSMKKDELDIQEARNFAELMMEESGSFLGELSAEEKEKFMDELMASFEESVDQDGDSSAAGELENPNNGVAEDGQTGATAAGETEDGEDEQQDSEENGEEEEGEEEEQEDGEEEEGEEESSDREKEAEDLSRVEDSGVEEADTEADRADISEVEQSHDAIQNENNEQVDGEEHITEEVIANEELQPQADETEELSPGEGGEEDTVPADETTMTEALESKQANVDKADEEGTSDKDVMAMTLTIRNKVNGVYIERPITLNKADKWTVEYALAEVPELKRARLLYKATKRRRFLTLNREKSAETASSNAWNDAYIEKLRGLSNKGRAWRQRQSKLEEQGPPKVL